MIPRLYAYAAVVAALVASHGWAYHLGAKHERMAIADERAEANREALRLTEKRISVSTEVSKDAQRKITAARAAARSADDAAASLRDESAALSAALDSAVAGRSEAAAHALRLHSDVLRQCGTEVADLGRTIAQLARDLDAARVAGDACQSAYEGLVSK